MVCVNPFEDRLFMNAARRTPSVTMLFQQYLICQNQPHQKGQFQIVGNYQQEIHNRITKSSVMNHLPLWLLNKQNLFSQTI